MCEAAVCLSHAPSLLLSPYTRMRQAAACIRQISIIHPFIQLTKLFVKMLVLEKKNPPNRDHQNNVPTAEDAPDFILFLFHMRGDRILQNSYIDFYFFILKIAPQSCQSTGCDVHQPSRGILHVRTIYLGAF